MSFPPSKAVILLGGSAGGGSFRPLSLDVPIPLFPIGGHEMLWHHLSACVTGLFAQSLSSIYLIGSYDASAFQPFLTTLQAHHASLFETHEIIYLQEKEALGTAGGLRHFKDQIIGPNDTKTTTLMVLHCDICCSFPLQEMMRFHLRHQGQCTVLAKRFQMSDSGSSSGNSGGSSGAGATGGVGGINSHGCIVQDNETHEVLHWAEKPETFVSDLINCGIYIMNVSMLTALVTIGDTVVSVRSEDRKKSVNPSLEFLHLTNVDHLRLEQDIFMPLAGTKTIYMFETDEFWCQIKTPGMAIVGSELYMERLRSVNPSALSDNGAQIEGNVMIHASATVDPSAKIGPNVCIGAGVHIGAGVRVAHSIILDHTVVKSHACILFSIIGWKSTIGQWCRIEGQPPKVNPSILCHTSAAARVYDSGAGSNDPLVNTLKVTRDVTIFGMSVETKAEVMIRNCIVLPNKKLTSSFRDEILL